MQPGSYRERWLMSSREELPDGPAMIVRLPGTAGFGAAHEALFDAVRKVTAKRVFVTGPGAAPTALWAARSDADVVTWHDHLGESLAVEVTFRENDLPGPRRLIGWDTRQLVPDKFDLALVHLPRGRAVQSEIIRSAGAVLRQGGILYVVGAKNEGLRSAVEDARSIFGHMGVIARKGGYHAAVAYRPESGIDLPIPRYQAEEILALGIPTHLVSCAGVFAEGRLDAGTAALVQTMQIARGSRVLDLGCGSGLAGLVALRAGADVVGTDVSARATASTRRTWAANGFPDARVHLCVGAAALDAGTFDTVITNPPFHRGRGTDAEVPELFVQEAARVLKAAGELYLVANAFLDYRSRLAENFSAVETAHEDRRFRVWWAHK
ncbi:MAG: methyltransferase [Anaerolineae bacterium]